MIGLLACASSGEKHPGALGWSLGGEAHVFVAGDRYARDFYRDLTGSRALNDSLTRRELVAVEVRKPHTATVLSAGGAAPARLTLARFHARGTCGYPGLVTELVLAFAPAGTRRGSSPPPAHVTVVALLEESGSTAGGSVPQATLSRAGTRDLVNRVAQRAESVSRGSRAMLVRQLTLDPDQAADAGEVIAFGSRYAVGFRARYTTAQDDTVLISGVAATDFDLHELYWVAKPQRLPLHGGMIREGRTGTRYSLRGSVAGPNGGTFLLVNEIADVSARDSRATAVDPDTRRVVATQPLALRCP